MKPSPEEKPHARSLWFWVIAAFLVLIAAWTALIIIAVDNQPPIIEVEKP